MVAIKASRAFTGRTRIAKVEGAYHGGYDYAEVSQTPRPENWGSLDRPNNVPLVHGTPDSSLESVVIIPFNDVDRALAILDENAADLAGVVLDPMPHRVGLNPVEPEFLEAIRTWTRKNGSLLVLDEVITFRSTYGGLQMRYGVEADLTAMGKMIGGGFPVGAVAGRADVMDVMDPNGSNYVFPHSGTFSANPSQHGGGPCRNEGLRRTSRGTAQWLDQSSTPGHLRSGQSHRSQGLRHRRWIDRTDSHEGSSSQKLP